MNFITAPLIVGIITLGIYKLFELFACRRERITLIEKLGEKMSQTDLELNGKICLPDFNRPQLSFGCLLYTSFLPRQVPLLRNISTTSYPSGSIRVAQLVMHQLHNWYSLPSQVQESIFRTKIK